MIEVLRTAGLATVQDLGRPGLGHLGIPPSGAADARSLVLGNRLLGNADGAAGLELTLAGPDLRFAADAVVALTGCPIDARLDGRPLGPNGPRYVHAGSVLKLGAVKTGARSYLAVRGGIAVAPVLGSRSTDVRTGLGPPRLRPGAALPIGVSTRPMPGVDLAPVPPPAIEPTLRLLLGPRREWFTPGAVATLCSSTFRVGVNSDRVGVRLEGPPLELARKDELASEAVVSGAVQVPPSGQPILLLVDRPTTGGYPVIGVLAVADLGAAAQLRPGQRLRFGALSD